MSSDYWRESVECALDEVGLTASDAQIASLARAFELSAEMQSEYTGQLAIPNPLKADIERLEKQKQQEAELAERQLRAAENLYCKRIGMSRDQVWFTYRDGGVEVTQAR